MKFASEADIEKYYEKKVKILNDQKKAALWVFRNGIKKEKPQKTKEDTRQGAMKKMQRLCVVRDTDPVYNHGYCISCGTVTKLQGGHYIDRSYKSICCSPFNINGQCSTCNNKTKQTSEDMIRIHRDYAFAMVAKYGEHCVRYLRKKKISSYYIDEGERGSDIKKMKFESGTYIENYWALGQMLRRNNEIPQDILDEVGG